MNRSFLTDDLEFMISLYTLPGKIFFRAGESILYALNNLNIPMKRHNEKEPVYRMMQRAIVQGFLK